MHTIPCGHLIEGQIPSCDTGRTIPEDCGPCPAYLPGLSLQERTRCEIWSRVMGYHRPVSNWNPGKQSEHADRVNFKEP